MFKNFRFKSKFVYKNKLAFFLKELSLPSKINIIDIGARSGLNKPYSYISENYYNIIGFEPDKNEFLKLIKKYKSRQYFNTAIFDKKKKSLFYLLDDKPASSLYEPNPLLGKKFENQHFEKRKVHKIFKIQTNKLDNFKNKITKLDFLKIDTQGSEFDILKGSSYFLKKYSPLILVETWSDEVYLKSKKFFDISKLLDKYGYRAIKIEDAANWRYKNNLAFSDFDQPIRIGYEILFVKNTELLFKRNFEDILNLGILLDLLGFKNFCYYLIKNHPKPNYKLQKIYLKKIIELNKKDLIFSKGVRRIFLKILIKLKLMDVINFPLHT